MCVTRERDVVIWIAMWEGEDDGGDCVVQGGPKDVVGKWQDGGIVFPDGNKWSKVEKEGTCYMMWAGRVNGIGFVRDH